MIERKRLDKCLDFSGKQKWHKVNETLFIWMFKNKLCYWPGDPKDRIYEKYSYLCHKLCILYIETLRL